MGLVEGAPDFELVLPYSDSPVFDAGFSLDFPPGLLDAPDAPVAPDASPDVPPDADYTGLDESPDEPDETGFAGIPGFPVGSEPLLPDSGFAGFALFFGTAA